MNIAVLIFLVLVGIAALVHIASLSEPATPTPETVGSYDHHRVLDRQAARQRYANR